MAVQYLCSKDGSVYIVSVVSLLRCVLLSWIKAWNSLWFYFWSHDTAFIYTAPATYPTINNSNVKNKMKCLEHYFLVSKVITWCTGLLSCILNICKTDNIVHFILAATDYLLILLIQNNTSTCSVQYFIKL